MMIEERIDNTILNVKNLMDSLDICINKDLDMLKISDDFHSTIKDKIL